MEAFVFLTVQKCVCFLTNFACLLDVEYTEYKNREEMNCIQSDSANIQLVMTLHVQLDGFSDHKKKGNVCSKYSLYVTTLLILMTIIHMTHGSTQCTVSESFSSN